MIVSRKGVFWRGRVGERGREEREHERKNGQVRVNEKGQEQVTGRRG